MNTVGIVGGIAPESTIEYYRLIVSSYLDREKNGNYPKIVINSINMKKMLDLIGENRLNEVVRYLTSEVNKLATAGADFVVLASNTPHIVFDEVQKASPLPMISIVEVTCEKVREIGIQKVGLFGTKFTMMGGFYDKVFAKENIEVIVPEEKDRDYIHEKYMNELVKGIFLDKTRDGLLNIATKIKQERGIQGLILGGTELPLILRESCNPDLPFLDTTRIHVEKILGRLI
ncbi:MAG: amino acid racemase [Pleurocapsa sp. MO_192.B19]|nr:amino acid racemase [Pleurocapsa sp. MO_192.B19]